MWAQHSESRLRDELRQMFEPGVKTILRTRTNENMKLLVRDSALTLRIWDQVQDNALSAQRVSVDRAGRTARRCCASLRLRAAGQAEEDSQRSKKQAAVDIDVSALVSKSGSGHEVNAL